MTEKGHYFVKLIDIISALRSEEGCPWDRVQTPDTVKRYIIEEAYEAIAAVESRNTEGLKEELGDLLFMTLFMAKLFDEKGIFKVEDVLETIASKMIYRHPHVFGDLEVHSAEEVEKNWQRLKGIEKEKSGKENLPSDLPRCLPALMRANRYISRVNGNTYQIESLDQLANRVRQNLERIEKRGEEIGLNEQKHCIGDMLMGLVGLARIFSVNAEDALQERLEELIRSESKR